MLSWTIHSLTHGCTDLRSTGKTTNVWRSLAKASKFITGMLNLLLRLSRCGWAVTKMKLSKLSGTLVEISWLVAVLRT